MLPLYVRKLTMKTNTTEGNLKSLIDSLKEKEGLLDLARARFDAAKIEDEYYIRTNKPAPNFGPARANLEALQSEVENLRFKVSQTDDEFRERAAIDAAPSALNRALKKSASLAAFFPVRKINLQ